MSKDHAILSELHRILSLYPAEELLTASRYPGLSRPLVSVLRSLAEESKAESITLPRELRASVNERGHAGRKRNDGTVILQDDATATDLIMRATISHSTQSILNFAAKYGLKLEPKPKENRERVAKRLAQQLIALPKNTALQMTKQLSDTANSQTEGWINVIRRRKS